MKKLQFRPRQNWKQKHHRVGERNESTKKIRSSQISTFWSGKAEEPEGRREQIKVVARVWG
jgi:hypothetical protein